MLRISSSKTSLNLTSGIALYKYYMTVDNFKRVDSMHMSFSKLNLIYLGKSLAWIVVIGGWGYLIFRKKNLF